MRFVGHSSGFDRADELTAHNLGRCEMNQCQIGLVELVVAGRDPAKVLQVAEHSLESVSMGPNSYEVSEGELLRVPTSLRPGGFLQDHGVRPVECIWKPA